MSKVKHLPLTTNLVRNQYCTLWQDIKRFGIWTPLTRTQWQTCKLQKTYIFVLSDEFVWNLKTSYTKNNWENHPRKPHFLSVFVFTIPFLYLCVFLFLFVSFCILNLIKSHGLSSQTTLTFEGDFRLVFSNWTWCQYFTFVFPLAVYSVNIWRKSFVKMAEKIGKLMCFLSAYCRRQNWLGDGGVWDF